MMMMEAHHNQYFQDNYCSIKLQNTKWILSQYPSLTPIIERLTKYQMSAVTSKQKRSTDTSEQLMIILSTCDSIKEMILMVILILICIMGSATLQFNL